MMTPEEFKSIVDDFKKKGMSDEDLAKAFLSMFIKGDVGTVDDLKTLLEGVGYNLNKDIEKVMRENPESLGVKSDSDKSDKKEEKEEDKDNKSDSNKKEEDNDKKSDSDKKEDDEKEWKEANKYFKLK